MTDPIRLTYLLNHCAGFMPTRDQWQEVVRLGNEMLLDRAHLCTQINNIAQLARDEQKKRQDYEESYRRVLSEECAPDEQHCSCVPALRAEIARLEEKHRWIPVSERLPDVGVMVQFGDCKTGEQVVGKLDRTRYEMPVVEVYRGRNEVYYQSNFTHWKPLDEPPKETPCQP